MRRIAQYFELNRGGTSSNLRSMEGLRGFAVLLVFLTHFFSVLRPWLPLPGGEPLDFEGLMGHGGVNLFFVLSGYLIYGSLIRRPQRFLPYIVRRVQRIYPAFLAVFAAYVLLSFLFPGESRIPRGAGPASIYLIQNLLLLPGMLPIEPLITVAWSLSYEMFYYLILPPFIAVLRLRERTAAFRTVLFLALGAVILVSHGMFEGPVRLALFVAGILLHETLTHANRRLPGRIIALILVAALPALYFLPRSDAGWALRTLMFCLIFFLLCLSCFRDPGRLAGRVFSWTPLRWLGNMSYSYYLLHGLTLNGLAMLLPAILAPGDHGPLVLSALLIGSFALTLLTAAVLFLAIERPLSLSPLWRAQAGAPLPGTPGADVVAVTIEIRKP